jgi:hypothetical protein
MIARYLAIAALTLVNGCDLAPAAGIHPTVQEIAACGGDAQRFCSAEIKAGTVLACLQVHRASLSKPCAALLLENGL